MSLCVDFPAVLWLEDYLTKYKGTLIIVSHDRKFLNSVSDSIMHLQARKLTYYKGDYETFLRVRADVIKQTMKEYEANQDARAHIQKFIDKFRYNAKRATLVQSRIKALDRLPVIELPEIDPPVELLIPLADPISNNVCFFVNVNVYFLCTDCFVRAVVSAGCDLQPCLLFL